MRISKITLGKEFKVGLPDYSNITLHCEMTFDIAENEAPDYEKMWDEINQQLYIQSGGIDPTWIGTKEYKKFFKVTVNQPKLINDEQKEGDK